MHEKEVRFEIESKRKENIENTEGIATAPKSQVESGGGAGG